MLDPRARLYEAAEAVDNKRGEIIFSDGEMGVELRLHEHFVDLGVVSLRYTHVNRNHTVKGVTWWKGYVVTPSSNTAMDVAGSLWNNGWHYARTPTEPRTPEYVYDIEGIQPRTQNGVTWYYPTTGTAEVDAAYTEEAIAARLAASSR